MVTKTHKISDFLDMEQLKLLSEKSVLVGGSAIAIMLGPEKIACERYPRSSDIDVVMTDREAIKLSESLQHELVEDNMVDRHAIKLGGGMSLSGEEINYRSPFTLMRINDYKMDIFTPSTGIGPISIDERVLGNSVKCNVEGLELRHASLDYIIATTINPLAATEARIQRSFLVISKYVQEHGSEKFFRDVLKPAITYMKEGSRNLKKVIAEIESGKYQRGNVRRAYFNHIFKQRKKIYVGYETYITKTMPIRLEGEKTKISGFVTHFGIGTKNENTDIVADVAKFMRKS
ncbi:MAG: hypothetical protein KGI06_03685 [Candidatus Micrarchaeota archaeon]|nr:hypothetical protein [Candidatus Micrarchaeota archaeon]